MVALVEGSNDLLVALLGIAAPVLKEILVELLQAALEVPLLF